MSNVINIYRYKAIVKQWLTTDLADHTNNFIIPIQQLNGYISTTNGTEMDVDTLAKSIYYVLLKPLNIFEPINFHNPRGQYHFSL